MQPDMIEPVDLVGQLQFQLFKCIETPVCMNSALIILNVDSATALSRAHPSCSKTGVSENLLKFINQSIVKLGAAVYVNDLDVEQVAFHRGRGIMNQFSGFMSSHIVSGDLPGSQVQQNANARPWQTNSNACQSADHAGFRKPVAEIPIQKVRNRGFIHLGYVNAVLLTCRTDINPRRFMIRSLFVWIRSKPYAEEHA